VSSNLPVNVDKARLPAAYTQARAALAKCEHIDECKTWADKAAALASYAKQAKDESLHLHARRIQSRAIRRAGELLKAIEPNPNRKAYGHTIKRADNPAGEVVGRTKAAALAGMGEGVATRAVQIASIPNDEFERAVESDTPPTLTVLAKRGTKKPRKLRRATVENSVDPLFLKISEIAALMDKRPARTVLAETAQQFSGGGLDGLDRTYIERLTFVRDWLTAVIDGSEQFIVTCNTRD